mmetsp:Transcript_36073/g.114995  ORF Transcript_36073/g.114995 Transcript_36073/m.114995 type:complete len:214 (+) Transcript_36073:1087-1728(+)
MVPDCALAPNHDALCAWGLCEYPLSSFSYLEPGSKWRTQRPRATSQSDTLPWVSSESKCTLEGSTASCRTAGEPAMREQGALSRGAGGVADEPPLSLGACKPAPSVGSAQHSILESVVATHSLSSDHAGVCSLCTAAPAVKRSRDAGPRRPTGPPSSVATPVASRLDHATVPSRLADKTDRNPAHGRMEKMESACGRSSTSTRRCERDHSRTV